MRSDQVTEPGFYWYFHEEEAPDVVRFVVCGNTVFFERLGMGVPYVAEDLPGQLIGPFCYGKRT